MEHLTDMLVDLSDSPGFPARQPAAGLAVRWRADPARRVRELTRCSSRTDATLGGIVEPAIPRDGNARQAR